ncbi:MAG: non-ribosomal peptide synthetase [Rhodobacterales bacterium]|nr:non-ribosomal peptide synthetase [Rhodobacterales bacterium]
MVDEEKNKTEVTASDFFDSTATISSLFMDQVRRRPNKLVVTEGVHRLTYCELAAKAATIADTLHRAGVVRGDLVCLLAPRGIAAVAAQLGILALGAAFVPLDPGTSLQGNRDVIKEAKPSAILSVPEQESAALALAPRNCPVIMLDGVTDAGAPDFAALLNDPECRTQPDDLAYVIYTSGSTGRPKGVMIAHRGVVRLVRGQSYADLGPDQVMLGMAAVGFDANIGEIYSAILNGGTLAILPDKAPSLDRIAEVIARENVTIAYITAGLFHVIVDQRPELLAPLTQVFPCGDVLSETHVHVMRRALPHLRMINGYGPTENTVFTCCFPIDDTWTGGRIPIGRGLAHDRLFVLDDELRPLPDGEIGQLAVGGAGIAIGYLGREDLTADAFVTLKDGDFRGRVYLTGDMVTRSEDGLIWFHGRRDRQIKINGQRVELDMIEHALRSDQGIEDAAVVATSRPDGSRQVVAFVTPALKENDAEAFASEVQGRMRAALPAAAVPSRIMVRDALPLNGSGKVDRKQLALDCVEVAAAPRPGSVPAQSLVQTIRDIWSDVLGRELPRQDKTFFEFGGTSLQLIVVHERLQQRLNQSFDIARLFEAPYARDLAKLLDPAGTPSAPEEDQFANQRALMARARGRRRRAL